MCRWHAERHRGQPPQPAPHRTSVHSTHSGPGEAQQQLHKTLMDKKELDIFIPSTHYTLENVVTVPSVPRPCRLPGRPTPELQVGAWSDERRAARPAVASSSAETDLWDVFGRQGILLSYKRRISEWVRAERKEGRDSGMLGQARV